MLSGTEGLFHFVFADQNDEFVTPTFIKMKFIPYLHLKLVQSNYQNIFMIGSSGLRTSGDYWLRMSGNQCEAILENNEPQGAFMKILSGLFNHPSETEETVDFSVRVMEVSKEILLQKLYNILAAMQQKNSIALSIPIEIFYELGEEPDFLQILTSLRNKSRNNIIVLTGTLSADDNNRFFLYEHLEYPRTNTVKENKNVFLNKNIFPEITRAFSENALLPYRVLHYDILQDTLNDRMQVWNSLSYNEIYNAVKYYFIHSSDMPLNSIGYSEQYAAVLWMWHHDVTFSDKYYNINFTDNPQHSMKLIINSIDREAVRNRIEEIIFNGFIFDREDIPEVYGNICGNTKDSIIVALLQEYRKILRISPGILNEDELYNLLIIIEYFRKPAFLHWKNATLPSYTKFSEDQNKKFIKKLFQHFYRQLETDLNHWDKGAIYIFYILTDMCYKDSLQIGDQDSFHAWCCCAFDKCMEAFRYILKQSDERPFAVEEAASFINEFINVLKTQNRELIRKHRIG